MNIIKPNSNNYEDIFLYVGIKDSLLFIKLRSIQLFNELFEYHQRAKFCFLNDKKAKEIIEEFTTNQFIENCVDIRALKKYSYYNFEGLLRTIRENPPIDFVFTGFHQLILLFLIKEAYNKMNKRSKNRMKYFISNYKNSSKTPINMIENTDFIEIQIINLVYYIDKKEMIVVKLFNYNEYKVEVLFHRERLFYETIKHPYLPIFYGIFDDKNNKMIMSEFINGKSLNSIKELHLEIKDKITIIFKIMIIIEYLNRNKFIYRDLKPSHVMIDNNKEIILVGFDFVKKYDPNFDEECHTCDIGSLLFYAPEVGEGKLSFKSDIYSLGKMIQYIMKEKRPDSMSQNNEEEEIFQYPEINQMIQNCIKKSPEEHPSICELIIVFYFYFHKLIDIGNLINVYEECFSNIYDIERIKKLIEQAQNDQEDVNFNIGMLYYSAELCPFNYNKSIYHFQQASNKHFGKANQILDIISKNKCELHIFNQSQIRAQINLGYFYLNQTEINQSIYFFALAANQNNPESQYQLGLIYYEHKFIQRDINKSIYYFTLAANQNNPESQYQLGLIYYENKFIQRDILKSIKFFSYADEQNYVESQLMLGKIYFENKFVKRDVHNVIYYYSRAAEQNNVEALRFLGQVYYNNELVNLDIQNTIYYFRLAAKQNDSISQYFLGCIYYENKYVERDIDKAIYYFTLAANQNNIQMQSLVLELFI